MAKKRSPNLDRLIALLLFIVLEVFSLVMISNSSFFQQIKIGGIYMDIRGSLSKAVADAKYYTSLRDVNRALAEENLRLQTDLERYRAFAELTENAADTIAADSVRGVGINIPDSLAQFEYIPARIVANSTNNKHNYLIINRGSRSGIRKDMGVVSPGGVVGIVSQVSERYAYVISLLNINQSVSAKIGKSGAFGPLIWDGKDAKTAVLTEIPQHIKFMVGDTVYTSGFSTLFPENIPIGTAGKSKIIRGTHHEIRVRLFQDFRTVRFVRVVSNKHSRELNELSRQYETGRK